MWLTIAPDLLWVIRILAKENRRIFLKEPCVETRCFIVHYSIEVRTPRQRRKEKRKWDILQGVIKLNLRDRIYGCMIGGAVGDAIGFATEGLHYEEIRRRYGRIEGPRIRAPPVDGFVYTDDTVMKHMVCEAIFESDGQPTIEAVADVWRRTIRKHDQWIWWNNTRVVAMKLQMNSLLPLREIGRDSIPCNDAAMIIGPVGMLYAGNPFLAAMVAWDISSLWQNGYSRECAAAMAACHAEALRPNASIESVIKTARQFSPTMRQYIDEAMDVVTASKDTADFTERYYDKCLHFPNENYWNSIVSQAPGHAFGADPLEVCTEALAFLALSKGNGREAIIGAANFGRDCDTICGIAAAFCGAINGPAAIPQDWQYAIQKANPAPNIMNYAETLYTLAKKNLDDDCKRTAEMQSILE